MAYKKLIGSNLRRAFRQLKDLAVDVVFVGREEAGFNFGLKTTKDVTKTSVTLQAIVLKIESEGDTVSSRSQQLLFQTAEASDIKTYDSVEIEGFLWSVGEKVFSDNFITLVDVHRQGAVQ